MLKKVQKPVYYIFSVAIVLHLSCNYFTEPEPFVNKDIHPPEIHNETANFRDYSEDQIVTGTVTLVFTPDWEPVYTDSIIVYVDSTRIDLLFPFLNYPFQFNINTSSWANGKHNIVLYAYRNPNLNDSLGTISLLTNTLFIYKTSLIFDNTPPTAPTNIKVILQNKEAHLSWTPTNLNNFNSYVIRRDENIIARIYSQVSAAYIDTTLPDFYNGYYEVGASNGPETVYSEKYNLIKGDLLGLNIIGAVLERGYRWTWIEAIEQMEESTKGTEKVNKIMDIGLNGFISLLSFGIKL